MMVPACFGVARKAGRTLLRVAVFAAVSLRGGTGGSISGTVTDPKEAVVANAQVTAINQSTNISQKVATNSSGIYSFPDLMVGTYDIQVEALGFRIYRRTDVIVDANAVLHVDVPLSLGNLADTIAGAPSGTHVETADTQLGEVVTGDKIAAVPLNGRSFTDLLALQPGVAPTTTIASTSIQAAGAAVLSPSGNRSEEHTSELQSPCNLVCRL